MEKNIVENKILDLSGEKKDNKFAPCCP